MFTTNNTVTCSHPLHYSSTSFDDTIPCIWLGTTHPCNPPNYGLWV